MSIKTIIVKIPKDTLYRIMGGQPVHAGIHVNKKLVEAGIPIVGTLWIETVERGKLTQYREGDDFVYSWTGEQQASIFEDDEI